MSSLPEYSPKVSTPVISLCWDQIHFLVDQASNKSKFCFLDVQQRSMIMFSFIFWKFRIYYHLAMAPTTVFFSPSLSLMRLVSSERKSGRGWGKGDEVESEAVIHRVIMRQRQKYMMFLVQRLKLIEGGSTSTQLSTRLAPISYQSLQNCYSQINHID